MRQEIHNSYWNSNICPTHQAFSSGLLAQVLDMTGLKKDNKFSFCFLHCSTVKIKYIKGLVDLTIILQ